jgi:hypothetical protein
MDDSTLTVGKRYIFPIFFAAYPLCASKDQKTAPISHASRNDPHSPTAS